MGIRSFVNPSKVSAGRTSAARPAAKPVEKPAYSRTNAARPARVRLVGVAGIDWILLGVVTGLTLFGLVMVYSAGPKFAVALGLDPEFFLWRQMIWAGVGIVAVFVLSRIPYTFFKRVSVLLMIATLAMLLLTATIGFTTLNSNRSLLSGSVRPSELAKLVTIIYVSVWLNAKRDVLNDMSFGLLPLMAILGLTGGFILVQPDISAAITVIILGGLLFFLGGGEWRQIALVLVASILFGWLVVNFYPTGIRRLSDYLAGLHNPLNASYHVQRSLEAIINGGFFGVGIGHGSTKFTGLPVAPTDSIFAVIAEEVGLLGAGFVILAYLVILWRGLKIAAQADDQLGTLIASGVTIWIVFEALLNMAVMVNLLPHAGNALPLVSYGGSSLLVTMAGIGILLNIARTSSRKDSQGGNPFGAVVDLRWRDRRRRVSRPGNSSGSR